MSVPAPPGAVTDLFARISALRVAPSAVSTIKARFGVSLGAAVASVAAVAEDTTATAGSGLTQRGASAGVEHSTGTATAAGLGSASSVGSGLTVAVSAATSVRPIAPTPASTVTAGDWATRLPAAGQPWASTIEAAAERNGLDPAYLAAAIWSESSFQPQVVSSAGAIGMGQLMPATAEYLGVDPWDPAQNIDGSARYYKNLIDRFGSVELGTAAYMSGPGAVAKAGGIPTERSQQYVDRILGRQAFLNGTLASPP